MFFERHHLSRGTVTTHCCEFASKIVSSEINACAYYSCPHNLRWSCVRSTFLKTHMSTVPHKYQQRMRMPFKKPEHFPPLLKGLFCFAPKPFLFDRSYNTFLATTSVPTTSKGAATLFCLRSFLTATAVSGCAKSIPRSQRRVRNATRSDGGCGKGRSQARLSQGERGWRMRMNADHWKVTAFGSLSPKTNTTNLHTRFKIKSV